MNFDQQPGMYNAKTNELIKNWNTLLETGIISTTDFESSSGTRTWLNEHQFDYKEPFYLILPEKVEVIDEKNFLRNQNLVGISGKGVKNIHFFCFRWCEKLEEIDFPKLEFIGTSSFLHCHKLREKHTKDGIFAINDKFLIDILNYKKEKLVIPENITVISESALSPQVVSEVGKSYVKEITLPAKLKYCMSTTLANFKDVILPLDFEVFGLNWTKPTNLIYKGSRKHFDELVEGGVILAEVAKTLKVEPYTFEEAQKLNFDIEKCEIVLGRKLTLDEILNLGKSIKEANDYFKGEDHEL